MTSTPFASREQSPRFATTRWSLVVDARDKVSPHAAEALADLCRAYWYPLYAFIRKLSRDGHEAQDLTQSFFVRLLEKGFLDEVQPERGRFRAFLLAAARHFLSNERDRERTIKRGGHLRIMSLDIAALDWDSGESRFLTEPVQDLTPERLFERQWALALLERVLMRMRDEYNTAGKSDLFETLQPFLSTDSGSANYTDAAATLEMTPEAARVAAHRFRKRYRQILKDEIANTVASPDDITDEIQHLFQALKS